MKNNILICFILFFVNFKVDSSDFQVGTNLVWVQSDMPLNFQIERRHSPTGITHSTSTSTAIELVQAGLNWNDNESLGVLINNIDAQPINGVIILQGWNGINEIATKGVGTL